MNTQMNTIRVSKRKNTIFWCYEMKCDLTVAELAELRGCNAEYEIKHGYYDEREGWVEGDMYR